ncbi:MAG: hypothetical protein KAT46_05310 [Deltaproteobacteria bacterium]|nr:hypothetical protein [Deltaproteobacteria bacterium]
MGKGFNVDQLYDLSRKHFDTHSGSKEEFIKALEGCDICNLLVTIKAKDEEIEARFKQLCNADETLALMTELKDKQIAEVQASLDNIRTAANKVEDFRHSPYCHLSMGHFPISNECTCGMDSLERTLKEG